GELFDLGGSLAGGREVRFAAERREVAHVLAREREGDRATPVAAEEPDTLESWRDAPRTDRRARIAAEPVRDLVASDAVRIKLRAAAWKRQRDFRDGNSRVHELHVPAQLRFREETYAPIADVVPVTFRCGRARSQREPSLVD